MKHTRTYPALLAIVLLGVCGCGQNSSAAAPVAAPSVAPTDVPVPTGTPITEYSRYLTWRSGMVTIGGRIKVAYYAMQAASRSITAGDYLNSEGRMQDAMDAIHDAQNTFADLTPPTGYHTIHRVMGHALSQYDRGVSDLTKAIGVGDLAALHRGVGEINQGASDLRKIRALDSRRQWMVWLDRNSNSAKKSGDIHT